MTFITAYGQTGELRRAKSNSGQAAISSWSRGSDIGHDARCALMPFENRLGRRSENTNRLGAQATWAGHCVVVMEALECRLSGGVPGALILPETGKRPWHTDRLVAREVWAG